MCTIWDKHVWTVFVAREIQQYCGEMNKIDEHTLWRRQSIIFSEKKNWSFMRTFVEWCRSFDKNGDLSSKYLFFLNNWTIYWYSYFVSTMITNPLITYTYNRELQTSNIRDCHVNNEIWTDKFNTNYVANCFWIYPSRSELWYINIVFLFLLYFLLSNHMNIPWMLKNK